MTLLQELNSIATLEISKKKSAVENFNTKLSHWAKGKVECWSSDAESDMKVAAKSCSFSSTFDIYDIVSVDEIKKAVKSFLEESGASYLDLHTHPETVALEKIEYHVREWATEIGCTEKSFWFNEPSITISWSSEHI